MMIGVAAGDVSGRSKIEVVGKDAEKFLHNLCTNDIKKLAVGKSCEALFLDARGKIVESSQIFRLDEHSFWLDAEPDRALGFIKHLDKYLIREAVLLHDRTKEYSQLRIFGAEARTFLASLIPSMDATSDFGIFCGEIGGIAVQIRRLGQFSPEAFDVAVAIEHTNTVQNFLASAVATSSPQADESAELEQLRILSGVPKFGQDYGVDNLPQELDRNEAMISFTKGCYIGQETVARLDSYGHVNRILRGVVCDFDTKVGASIQADEKEVGTLTSLVPVADRAKAYGLAILRSSAAKPGTMVKIISGGESYSGEVSALPFPL